MLCNRAVLVSAALFASRALAGGDHYETETLTSTECESETATYGSYVTTTHTTKTDYATTTHLVEIDSTVTKVHTQVVESYVTECITTTLYYTDLVTKTNTETDVAYLTNTLISNVTTTNTDTDTDTAYVTNTLTDSTTLTDTESVTITGTAYETVTTTNTVPTEVTTTGTVSTTTFTTTTIFSTSFNPCPTECSVSAETVNLYFWPTDRPHTYPTTWVDKSLDYTFTYPSVYMLVPTAAGVNNASQTLGPQTKDWVIALDLTEVSTIVSSTATVQLQLSDIYTDCPKSVAPGAIATMAPDPHCNPILAAPSEVKSWAYPCNACGQFGLFDPPYAAPTLTGPLVIPTTTTTAAEASSTVVVVPTATATETEPATTEEPTGASSTVVVIPPAPMPTVSTVPPVSMPTVSTEIPPVSMPTVSEPPPVSMPTVSEIPPVSMPTISTDIPPVSMPTVSTEVPPVSMPTVTESTSQPIPTAAATNLHVAMGSLFSVFLMALAL